MIPPTTLARLASLELVARTVVDGALHGTHRTDRPGFSQEFAEYRDYVPGDDPRFVDCGHMRSNPRIADRRRGHSPGTPRIVDWNAYARTDRPLLKLFEGETNTRLLVLVDASASMDAFRPHRDSSRDAGERPTKLRYAAFLSASLAFIAARQHDAAGLMVFDESVRTYLPPRPGNANLHELFHRLDEMMPSGGSDWAEAFTFAASRLVKRGVIAAVSDFYCDPAVFGRALGILGARGHDLIVFHVLDAEERQPPTRGAFGSSLTLRDVESGRVIEVDGNDLRTRYAQRLTEHQQALRREAGAVGAHYVPMNADEPLDRALMSYLRFRTRRP